jgi:hypothetical protein
LSELGNALRSSQVTRFKGGLPPDDFADPTGADANDKLLEAMSFH